MWKADIEVSSNVSKISLSLMGEPETHIEESDLILIPIRHMALLLEVVNRNWYVSVCPVFLPNIHLLSAHFLPHHSLT